MPYLFLLFILMPIIEIAVLIQVGRSIGVLLTIAIVIATAILGTAMLRHQGMATLRKAQTRMQSGEMPAQQLLEGLLLVVGGVLLLTP
ncbi:MAG: FxsA family protein, partial [Gammaproteobacteria bacterium]|nr:FxsA family protein [Gammaproteobacteria bacterium]